MATPGELVSAVAKVLGLPQATVALHDRALAEQGYRRTGGRGRSSIKVSPEDAAHLLIAVVAAPIAGPAVKDTISNFKQYQNLVAHKDSQEPGDWSEINAMTDLSLGHSFGAALAALIRDFAAGKFERADYLWKSASKNPELHPGFVNVDVQINSPRPYAEISVYSLRSDIVVGPKDSHLETLGTKLIYDKRSVRAGANLRDSIKKSGNKDLSGDLTQIRKFTDETLRTLGELFVDRDQRQTNQ